MIITDLQQNNHIFNGSFLRIWSHRSKIPLFKLKNELQFFIKQVFKIYKNISICDAVTLAKRRLYIRIEDKLYLTKKDLRKIEGLVKELEEENEFYQKLTKYHNIENAIC